MAEYQYQTNGISITSNEAIDLVTQLKYINYYQGKQKDLMLKTLKLTFTEDDVKGECSFQPEGFERIRRITGYLVGTLDRFNDGKAAEERDRVKHEF